MQNAETSPAPARPDSTISKIVASLPLPQGQYHWNAGYVSPRYFFEGMTVYVPVRVTYEDGFVKRSACTCTVYAAHGNTARVENKKWGLDVFVSLGDVCILEGSQ